MNSEPAISKVRTMQVHVEVHLLLPVPIPLDWPQFVNLTGHQMGHPSIHTVLQRHWNSIRRLVHVVPIFTLQSKRRTPITNDRRPFNPKSIKAHQFIIQLVHIHTPTLPFVELIVSNDHASHSDCWVLEGKFPSEEPETKGMTCYVLDARKVLKVSRSVEGPFEYLVDACAAQFIQFLLELVVFWASSRRERFSFIFLLAIEINHI